MKWALGVLVLAVTITVIAASFSPRVEALAPDEALLRLFPADSIGVLYADISELLGSELLQGILLENDAFELPNLVEEFSIRTGLDPFTDLEQAMLGRTGKDTFLGVARASYDPVRVEEYFRDRDVEFESYAGRALYWPDPEEDWKVSFIDDLVLTGDDLSVRGAIDRLNDSAATAIDDPLLLEGIESIEEGSQVWAVVAFEDFLLPNGIVPPMALDLIASLEGGTYQMRLDSVLTGRAVGQFRTPETARRTGDLLRGLVAFGKMQAFEQPEMIELLDGVQIDNVESSVEIHFAVDGELLRRIPVPFPGR